MAASTFRALSADLIEGQSSTRNYIKNGDAHSAVAGWSLYDDGASSRPVDGTGGAPSVTWTRETTGTIAGDAHFLFAKNANNRQGQGVAYAFTIDDADRAKVMEISFDYEYNSGTYSNGTETTDSDLICYVYDVTNGVLIEPDNFKINAVVSGQYSKFRANFQTNANSSSYRLIIHVATTSALAIQVYFDRFRVVASEVAKSDSLVIARLTKTTNQTIPTSTQTLVNWEAKTYDTANAFDLSTDRFTAPFSGYYEIQVRISYTAAVAAVNAITLRKNGVAVSTMHRADTVDGNYSQGADTIYLVAGDYIEIYVNQNTGADRSIDGTAAGFTYLNIAQVKGAPNGLDMRVMGARVTKSANQTIPTGTQTKVVWQTETYDTHGAFDNVTNNRFTAPVAGYYEVAAKLAYTASVSAVSRLSLYKNGVIYCDLFRQDGADGQYQGGTDVINLVAGDYLEIFTSQNSGADRDVDSTTTTTYASFTRVQGPASIAPTETVASRAVKTTGSHTSSGSTQDVASWTSEYDTHSAFNVTTGVFTAPAAGYYEIEGLISFDGNATGTRIVEIQKNGTGTFAVWDREVASAAGNYLSGSCVIKLVAGDTLRVRAFQDSGGNLSYTASTGYNHVQIHRLGV